MGRQSNPGERRLGPVSTWRENQLANHTKAKGGEAGAMQGVSLGLTLQTVILAVALSSGNSRGGRFAA